MTWVGRRGDLQTIWDSCMPLCLQWGIFQYFRQFCFFTGRPSNSSLSPCFPGTSVGQCAHAVHCFYSPTGKEASLAGGCSFEEGKDAFGKITPQSLAPGLVMQADPTELGCSPQSTLCVSPLTAGPGSSCSGGAPWQHPPGPSYPSQSGVQPNTNKVSSRNRCQQPSPRATGRDGS